MKDHEITEDVLLGLDIFGPSDAIIELHKKKMVTARKPHKCFGLSPSDVHHFIEPGERYRYETALVDGHYWGKYRVCISCLVKEAKELYGDTD